MKIFKSILLLMVSGFAWSEQCQITSPLPVPVLLTGCTYSGTLPSNSTSYIQNTLTPTTTTQLESVQTSSITKSEYLGYLSGTQCLQETNGLVSGTGVACGSGSGGSSTPLAVSSGSATSSVIVSSPTINIIVDSNTFVASLQGSTSAFLQLNPSSVTLQGIVSANSLGALTTSSATATYLQLSSAAITYLQNSSATATYLQLSSATASYLLKSSATVTYLQLSSATATYLTKSSATVTYVNKLSPVAYTNVDNNFSANQTLQDDITVNGTSNLSVAGQANTGYLNVQNTINVEGNQPDIGQCLLKFDSPNYTDSAGTVKAPNFGPNPIECTITFSGTYTNTPTCLAQIQANNESVFVSSIDNSAFTISTVSGNPLPNSAPISWICIFGD